MYSMCRAPRCSNIFGCKGLHFTVSRYLCSKAPMRHCAGESQAELAKSPFLEQLLERGYEVLYMTDPVDEYLMQHLTEFDDKPFQNASKDNLKLAKGDKQASKKAKAWPLFCCADHVVLAMIRTDLRQCMESLHDVVVEQWMPRCRCQACKIITARMDAQEEFKDLVAWWQEQLSGAVQSVKVSSRLASSPAIVVTSQYAWSANMERIMRAQVRSKPKLGTSSGELRVHDCPYIVFAGISKE